MAFLADLVVNNLSSVTTQRYPSYENIIQHCFTENPPFAQDWFGRRYFELARNSEWFANSLVANSTLEGYGSTQIWKFSNKVKNEHYATGLRNHAIDESKHSSMFIKMLEHTFPGIEYDQETRKALDEIQPRFTKNKPPPLEEYEPEELLLDHDALDELIQVHITEIRALVLQFLLRPVLLTYAPDNKVKLLEKFSDVLISDEARHIRYTAEFFEDAANSGNKDFLFSAFEKHVGTFNDLTLEELEQEIVEI